MKEVGPQYVLVVRGSRECPRGGGGGPCSLVPFKNWLVFLVPAVFSLLFPTFAI